MSNYDYTYNVSIPYPTYQAADIVCKTINVDKELKPEQIQRSVYVTNDDNTALLHIEYKSSNLHLFRTAISSLYELVILSTQTVAQFQLTNKQVGEKQKLNAT